MYTIFKKTKCIFKVFTLNSEYPKNYIMCIGTLTLYNIPIIRYNLIQLYNNYI